MFKTIPLTLFSLKPKCHFDESFVSSCTGCCHVENFRCSQWRNFRQKGHMSVSVLEFMHKKSQMLLINCQKPYQTLSLSTPSKQHLVARTASKEKLIASHYDVIKWKPFPRNWLFVRGIHRSSVNSPHKGQWRGALIVFFICTRINDWANNCEAGDLRHHRAHYCPACRMRSQQDFEWWWSVPLSSASLY